jgi:hypothetical protein
MMTLLIAAAVAAEAAPPADTPGQAAPMQHEKKDCCKDGCECCKDMADKHTGHSEHADHQK